MVRRSQRLWMPVFACLLATSLHVHAADNEQSDIRIPSNFTSSERYTELLAQAKKSRQPIAILHSPGRIQTRRLASLLSLQKQPALRGMIRVMGLQHDFSSGAASAYKKNEVAARDIALLVVDWDEKGLAYVTASMSESDINERLNTAAAVAQWRAKADSEISSIELDIKKDRFASAADTLERLVNDDERLLKIIPANLGKSSQAAEKTPAAGSGFAPATAAGSTKPSEKLKLANLPLKGFYFNDLVDKYRPKIEEGAASKVSEVRKLMTDGALQKALSAATLLAPAVRGLPAEGELATVSKEIRERMQAERKAAKPERPAAAKAGRKAKPGDDNAAENKPAGEADTRKPEDAAAEPKPETQ